MKRIRIKFLLAAIGLSMTLVVSAHSFSIYLDPSNSDVTVGANFNVDLWMSGGTSAVSFYEFDILFNPTILGVNGVTFGDPVLGNQLDVTVFGTSSGFSINGGSVNLHEESFDSQFNLENLQANWFIAATLNFEALTEGSSNLDPTPILVLASDRNPFPDSSVSGGTVTVRPAQVPEPSTLLLLGTGLIGLAGFRRKFRN